MLKCKDLTVEVNDKIILNKFNLNINKNEVHALMGPNGIGKSTICKAIIGEPSFLVSKGMISYNDKDLLKLSITQRAREGIYYLNQTPIEIPGVTNAEMLRIALSEKTNTHVPIFDFNKKLEEICTKLAIPKAFIHRGINEGMSGGERKKNELLHLWMLEPSLILLDELDSGLDIDSLKIVCENINAYRKEKDVSILIISHHQELLEQLGVDYVHILSEESIIETGDLSLAKKIEKEGYKKYNSGANNE